MNNNKVCICFYGLTRSLKYTYSSINNNLFKVLESYNIEYDIYLHSYNLEFLTNKRSKEFNEKLDINEFKILNPKKYIIDNQDEFDESFDYESVKKYGDYWKDNFGSLYNLIRQLNSLKKVTSLIKNKPIYNNYIYVRPDLKFVDKINIEYIKYSDSTNYLLTPNFAKWGGLNDRFVIGNYNSIIIYGERINNIFDYMKLNGPLHAERLIKFIVNKYNIKNIDINILFLRIRSNGKIPVNDLLLLKK